MRKYCFDSFFLISFSLHGPVQITKKRPYRIQMNVADVRVNESEGMLYRCQISSAVDIADQIMNCPL